MERPESFFWLESYLDISFFANVGTACMGGPWGVPCGQRVSFKVHGSDAFPESSEQPQALLRLVLDP